ncbi:regulator of protease activity HflC (stomatin/prohibitin superfamily) [Saccharothrix tamanrassetensis]|uniref:Regulator of protease activity HflC (Stomatin/prohibitin superfamily) n=1 Tax=Saccharothrix tamanrassetensis TaxID=1051531 RepID=A0A841CS39_9PSEU|nr:slipin family protein [Saccharothrix tamanrassetensis]MBB5960070.1 regulator of protease activity HflC (stomatin/prohibitin superfamily) [Saccharothrix tamanrassetensis]
MRHTLLPWERGVHFRRGCLVGELGPGEHDLGRRDTLHRVDTRARSHTPAWQDVPTSDGVLVRVTLVVTWSVADATAFVVAAADPAAELHLALQLALRTAVLARTHDRVDPDRSTVADEVQDIVRPKAVPLGVDLTAVAVRDVVMPTELRKAALAELVARSEARAALERARGETAALRSLLNAARLAEEHPALLQLRSLQSAQTVVVRESR